MSYPEIEFIRRDLDLLEGFVLAIDDKHEHTARQRRLLTVVGNMRRNLNLIETKAEKATDGPGSQS